MAFNYWKTDKCKFESSQKDESGEKQENSSQAGHQATACFAVFINLTLTCILFLLLTANVASEVRRVLLIQSAVCDCWQVFIATFQVQPAQPQLLTQLRGNVRQNAAAHSRSGKHRIWRWGVFRRVFDMEVFFAVPWNIITKRFNGIASQI